ncbi:MAG: hypothetical protein A2020_06010 [Lentisphaerae bacterium GWF2_45_14]|nr:MAG: hypothetical protein A2020_06010 [Lentisphaerae bacterium GWF2_45_14]
MNKGFSTLILCLFCLSATAQVKPEFAQDGSIVLGDKKIIPGNNGEIILSLEDGKRIEMNQQFSLGNIDWTCPKEFKDKSFVIDQKNKNATFAATLIINGKPANYSISVKLLDDGLALVSSKFTLPDANIKVNYANMYISGAEDYFVNGKIDENGKPFPLKPDDFKLEPGAKTKVIVPYRKNASYEFFPDQPDSAFAINCRKYNVSAISAHSNKMLLVILPEVNATTRTIEFTIDIRKYSEAALKNQTKAYAGIDFWKNNRQYAPDYTLCKNLIQNPSFEGGLRYFTPNAFGGLPDDSQYQYLYNIDDQTAAKGHKSLNIKIFKEVKSPTPFGTFVIPLKTGVEYTVSFFAKADKPETWLGLYGYTCNNPTTLPFKKKTFKLTDKWERYSTSFKAPNSGGGIYFSANNSNEDGNAWLDALQLEEGSKLSDYTEKPVGSALLTSDKDNFIKYGNPVDATLEISSSPDRHGKVKIAAEDFFYKKLFEQEYDFTADKNGVARIKLPFDSLPRGIFNIRTDFELDNGFKESDFHRLAIMDFLEGKHKNRRIFSNTVGHGAPRISDVIQRLKRVGIGAICKRENNKHQTETASQNGIWHSGGSIAHSVYKGGIFVDDKNGIDIKNIKPEELTPEMLKEIEDACAETVASRPWIRDWYLLGEINDGRLKFLSIEDQAKLFAAGYRGMKKASPQSKYIIPAPWNMYPGSGIAWQENFIKACEGSGIDWGVADIHVYRNMPENPDLDADAASYFAMLERNGLGKLKVNWGEGIYYPPYNIPEWNLNCYNGGASADHYYLTSPSYHMSWGEKISAAFYARSWLVALKYADKVQTLEGWAQSNRFFMDANLTPFALQKIPNTLGRLLGNADFKTDIRFAPYVRAYVFEDEQKRPVAAMWSHFGKVDHGLEKAPTAFIPFGDAKLEIFDLMEAPLDIKPDKDGIWKISASPFPVFIRGEQGTLDKFCAAINQAMLDKAGLAPLSVCSEASAVNQADVKITNLLTRAFSGSIVISSARKITEKLVIPSAGSKTIHVPLAENIADNKIIDIKLPFFITDKSSGKEISSDASFRAFAVRKTDKKFKIDGDLADWEGIPFIKIANKIVLRVPAYAKDKYPNGIPIAGENDHSAEYKMTWSDKFLYLAIKVKDDVFTAEDRCSVGQLWNNDSLQVFIDTFGDARGKMSNGFDSNDYNYDFFPRRDGSLLAYRRINPERQLCGGLKSGEIETAIKTAFKILPDGYIYEIAFPARYLLPLQLKAGSSCGFALYLNDHDGGYVKWAHTLSPEGTAANMNPHLYPVMLLAE